METELKLLIAPADVAAFRRLALLPTFAAGRPVARRQHDIYFDTPERYLLEHGMSLRVRRVGRASVQTLKADDHAVKAGLHQRQEWESRVSGPLPELAPLLALVGAGSRWKKLLGAPGLAQTLAPVFGSEVRRTVWQLRLDRGARVELALDQGELRRGETSEAISEVELELKAGEPGALFDLALQLQEQVPLRVGNLSKSARGYALQAPPAVAAVKARPVLLNAGMTVEEGFREIAGNCLLQMQDNEPGVVLGTCPECVHQMRVGMRRWRSALRLFALWIPFPPALQQELAWLGGELGAARDADVLAGSTLPGLVEACPAERTLSALASSASAIARDKRRAAAAAVASVRQSRLMLGLVAWLQASRWRESLDVEGRAALAEPLDRHARRIVIRRHEKLLATGKRLVQGTDEERHRVRIAAKKSRYASDFFRSLHAARRAERYLRRLAELQDALGAMNDAVVADRLLRDIEARSPERASGASFARGYLRAARAQDLRRLFKQWQRLGSMPPL